MNGPIPAYKPIMQANDTTEYDPVVVAAYSLAERMGIEYLSALAIVQATQAA